MYRLVFFIFPLLLASCGNVDSTVKSKDEAVDFKWDFTEQKKIIYSFTQTTSAADRREKGDLVDKHYFVCEGELHVRVKEDSLANLSLTSLKVTSVDEYADAQSPGDTSTQEVPGSVFPDMKPDGDFIDKSTNATLSMLFSVPNKPMEIGDSCVLPKQFPFNANGSRLLVTGQSTLVFVGYEEMEGRNCAVLIAKIDISQLNVPEELDGEYAVSNTGYARYYFDLEEGLFVGSDIQIVMKMFMDSKIEDDEFSGMFMDMSTEEAYKIRLKKIEE